jgi:hypothetical protein
VFILYNNVSNKKHRYHFFLDACSCRSNSPISESTGKSPFGQCTFGKFCITAESPFLQFYDLKEDEICINALPNVDYLVEKLSLLIENRFFLISIGEKARNFVLKYHEATKIASKYVEKYENNN